jgi:hypothetical protein
MEKGRGGVSPLHHHTRHVTGLFSAPPYAQFLSSNWLHVFEHGVTAVNSSTYWTRRSKLPDNAHLAVHPLQNRRPTELIFCPPTGPVLLNIGNCASRHRDNRAFKLVKKTERNAAYFNIRIYASFWHSEDRPSWYFLIIKANKMRYFSTSFW